MSQTEITLTEYELQVIRSSLKQVKKLSQKKASELFINSKDLNKLISTIDNLLTKKLI